ncbi:putative SOS response-associated peptidase YedK [Salsuginibacillus halophilus]|uniref:Abasic site processing protein n=1 Tax=Salsuginibacillus halophilus TaxID=517424 RepID=A0A2P8HQF1_9BACI|nr:SOS response-associated peptidase [Salsuginibacillus halophilus]PSL48446.1 putative SOS response-associated peptidase YedK [Salsuginibacillus halophilus]
MCGRFTLHTDLAALETQFGLRIPPVTARYNISPTQYVLAAVSGDGKRWAGFFHWGLIPSEADDMRVGARMINVEAEKLEDNPAFVKLLRRQRCIIAADGFYKWGMENGVKQPYYMQLASGEPFAFAGLWDQWQSRDETILSCTIITTKANRLIAPIHDRMPVLLNDTAQQAWLDQNLTGYKELAPLLTPYPSEEMKVRPVTSDVNSPMNDHKALLAKV